MKDRGPMLVIIAVIGAQFLGALAIAVPIILQGGFR